MPNQTKSRVALEDAQRFADERDDATLLADCRRGDASAWEALVHRYQRLIYAIPRRAGLDDDHCADVFQRTFTLLVEHLDRINQPDHIRAWLVTTARRETQRIYQKAARSQPLPGEDEAESGQEQIPMLDPAAIPDAVIMQLEEQHLVRTAMTRLDERCRRLITMLFYQTEPARYDEISTAIGIPAGSIGPTRARCLQKLSKILTEIGF